MGCLTGIPAWYSFHAYLPSIPFLYSVLIFLPDIHSIHSWYSFMLKSGILLFLPRIPFLYYLLIFPSFLPFWFTSFYSFLVYCLLFLPGLLPKLFLPGLLPFILPGFLSFIPSWFTSFYSFPALFPSIPLHYSFLVSLLSILYFHCIPLRPLYYSFLSLFSFLEFFLNPFLLCNPSS